MNELACGELNCISSNDFILSFAAKRYVFKIKHAVLPTFATPHSAFHIMIKSNAFFYIWFSIAFAYQ